MVSGEPGGDPLSTAAKRIPGAAADELAEVTGYRVVREELIAEALTHRSALRLPRKDSRSRRGVVRPPNYERLEFLGDRVLGLIIADLLWRGFENEPEGPLTRRHAQLVRRETLAQIASEIGLDRYLVLSPADAAAGAARNPGILADALEALIAAIYLDGGFEAAFMVVVRLWQPLIAAMDEPPRDPKTMLQEWAQARGLPLPAYEIRAASGPAHARHFTVAVQVAGFAEADATAPSKRAAEAAAAAAFLERLRNDAAARR